MLTSFSLNSYDCVSIIQITDSFKESYPNNIISIVL